MDISEVAKTSGVPASTLRYYEEKGLIQSIGRKGLRRLFNADVLQRLALISLGRGAGLSLDEIGKMFTSEGPEIDRALLLAKADELDHKITELTAIRDNLRHTAACPAPNHFECPTFLRLLHIAEKKQLGQRNKLGKNNIRSGVRKT
ncbi:MAG: helix-turn-helix domain-containing protein [Anaerolineae bacterium]|nr:helix-turn-helix domain-containing protein [Anaerolineae bacterium]